MLLILSVNLISYPARDGVRPTDLVAPVAATTNRNEGELRGDGDDHRAANRGRHLLGALHPEAHMTVVVADRDERLEAGTLAGPGLVLHRHNLEHLVLESLEQRVEDLVLLNEVIGWIRLGDWIWKFGLPNLFHPYKLIKLKFMLLSMNLNLSSNS